MSSLDCQHKSQASPPGHLAGTATRENLNLQEVRTVSCPSQEKQRHAGLALVHVYVHLLIFFLKENLLTKLGYKVILLCHMISWERRAPMDER